MTSIQDPPSQEDVQVAQSNVVTNDEEPFPAVDVGETASPAPSGSSVLQRLTREDSAPSDKISMRSHTSIPVVGTFPLGSLRVHKAMDSPRPQRPEEPQPGTSDMPPLEGDQQVATTGASIGGGDIFLLLDLPPNTTVGCDAKAIGTGTSHFQGLRDIPPGSHFIWVSEPNAMSRCGYWFLATPQRQQVRVKQWDKFNEVLVTPASDYEARDMRDNVGRLYPQLVPYGTDGSSRQAGAPREEDDAALLWRRLSTCIGEKLLARVTGKSDVGEWLVDTSDSAAGDEGFLHSKTTQTYQTLIGTGQLNFLLPEGDVDLHTATELGEDAEPDTSMDILRLLDTPGTGVTDADLIGELQFTFLTGLHLSNLACIEHWWHLVLKIMLRAHQLVILRPEISLAFLNMLHSQMLYNERYISSNHPSDDDDAEPRHEYGATGSATSLLEIIPGNKRKLREALTLYKRRMNELLLNLPGGQVTPEQGQVGQAFVEVEEWFWKLGWDLRTDYVQEKKRRGHGEAADDDDPLYDEDDEYKPVIVNLDAHGREVGLVSFT